MNFKKQVNYLAARPQPLFQLQPAGRFAGTRWRGIRAPASGRSSRCGPPGGKSHAVMLNRVNQKKMKIIQKMLAFLLKRLYYNISKMYAFARLPYSVTEFVREQIQRIV
jgi:hypothetical protein